MLKNLTVVKRVKKPLRLGGNILMSVVGLVHQRQAVTLHLQHIIERPGNGNKSHSISLSMSKGYLRL